MIIVYVIDNYGEFSNGTTVTAKRSKEKLEAKGHTVRIVSAGNFQGEGYYQLKKRRIPIVSYVAAKQKTYFAKPDKNIFNEAFKDADLVHFFYPFKASRIGVKYAKKMGVPVSSAYHFQPEHVTYGMGLGKLGKPLAWLIYKRLKYRFYNHVKHIHCPSQFIADEIKRLKYKNVAHPITNGVEDKYFTQPDRKKLPKIQILSIGRYALEKRQDTTIKAINKSKYKDQIEVIFAGLGPKKRHLEKLAKRLKVNAKFNFYSQEELIKTIAESTLYIHAADVETEGISALEAIASGLVPIIASSKKAATKQFALDDRSLFKAKDYKTLAKKIDYWLDNEEERFKMSESYQNYIRNYGIDNAINLLEEMFKEAIKDKNKELATKTNNGQMIKKHIVKSRIKRIGSTLFYYGIAIPILGLYFYLFRGLRIKGKKHLKHIKGGAVLVSNHIHKLDSVMNALVCFPKKLIFTSIQENFDTPVVGQLINILGATPTPKTVIETKVFFHELSRAIGKGRFVHFFPEGDLKTKDSTIREFKKGAFQLAVENHVPIIPIRILFKEKKHKYGYPFFMKDRIIIKVSKPEYPNIFLLRKDSISDLLERAYTSMIAASQTE